MTKETFFPLYPFLQRPAFGQKRVRECVCVGDFFFCTPPLFLFSFGENNSTAINFDLLPIFLFLPNNFLFLRLSFTTLYPLRIRFDCHFLFPTIRFLYSSFPICLVYRGLVDTRPVTKKIKRRKTKKWVIVLRRCCRPTIRVRFVCQKIKGYNKVKKTASSANC